MPHFGCPPVSCTTMYAHTGAAIRSGHSSGRHRAQNLAPESPHATPAMRTQYIILKCDFFSIRRRRDRESAVAGARRRVELCGALCQLPAQRFEATVAADAAEPSRPELSVRKPIQQTALLPDGVPTAHLQRCEHVGHVARCFVVLGASVRRQLRRSRHTRCMGTAYPHRDPCVRPCAMRIKFLFLKGARIFNEAST